jgi:hypothetical protein
MLKKIYIIISILFILYYIIYIVKIYNEGKIKK